MDIESPKVVFEWRDEVAKYILGAFNEGNVEEQIMAVRSEFFSF